MLFYSLISYHRLSSRFGILSIGQTKNLLNTFMVGPRSFFDLVLETTRSKSTWIQQPAWQKGRKNQKQHLPSSFHSSCSDLAWWNKNKLASILFSTGILLLTSMQKSARPCLLRSLKGNALSDQKRSVQSSQFLLAEKKHLQLWDPLCYIP